MLDWLKHLLKKEELPPAVQKPVIITIHGYGRRRRNEFDNFAAWGKQDSFDIIQFDMYDLFDEQDHDWMQWVSRAKEVVDSYRDSGRDIYLAGFSMGGVIASYLAVVCPVKRLLLLAPAFSYMNVDIITGVLTKSASSLMGNEKKEEIQLPRAFYGAFTELVKNLRKYIGFVECPVFIIHGNADEVISVKSSLWAYNKIPHCRKKLILLHDGHHRLLMDPEVSWTCYQNMKLFFEGVLLPDNEPVMAEDIMGALLEEKKRREREKQSQEPALNPLRVQTDESQHTDSCQTDAGAKI